MNECTKFSVKKSLRKCVRDNIGTCHKPTSIDTMSYFSCHNQRTTATKIARRYSYVWFPTTAIQSMIIHDPISKSHTSLLFSLLFLFCLLTLVHRWLCCPNRHQHFPRRRGQRVLQRHS